MRKAAGNPPLPAMFSPWPCNKEQITWVWSRGREPTRSQCRRFTARKMRLVLLGYTTRLGEESVVCPSPLTMTMFKKHINGFEGEINNLSQITKSLWKEIIVCGILLVPRFKSHKGLIFRTLFWFSYNLLQQIKLYPHIYSDFKYNCFYF
jgi:hypothetical protein